MTGAQTGNGLQVREPGAGIPRAVREAAARAARGRQSADLVVLLRVLTGLRRLPGPCPAGDCSPAVSDYCPPSSR